MSDTKIQFPTSSDIYLEANGKKIAVVQNYRSVSKRTEKTIEAFGESEPVLMQSAMTQSENLKPMSIASVHW